ncbi:MAG: hypothetical protein GY920_08835 [Aliivibrio sp.]|nr:hypothetical protein [Aliivibrio sp.]
MSIINSVRETVLSVLNKNNYGYITPSDFNLYAKQAQLDIFEDYFYQYNYQITKENARQSGIGLADIKQTYQDAIELFSEQQPLAPVYLNGASEVIISPSATSTYSVPTTATTGSDYYLINKVLLLTRYLVANSTNTLSFTQELVDSTKNFFALGVQPGDVVVNLTTGESTSVRYLTPQNTNTLSLENNIFPSAGDSYTILSTRQGVNECEKVTNKKITQLNMSNLTKPTELFPAYSQNGTVIQVYPENFQWGLNVINSGETSAGRILCQYIRYPKDPKWTYAQLVGGEPSFNQSDALYQDFELPLEDEPTLVNKILQYAGMSIREVQAIQFGQSMDMREEQNQK